MIVGFLTQSPLLAGLGLFADFHPPPPTTKDPACRHFRGRWVGEGAAGQVHQSHLGYMYMRYLYMYMGCIRLVPAYLHMSHEKISP